MKRFVLLSAVCLFVLAASAAPALAWYAPKPQTAFIDGLFVTSGWDEWAGPGDPYGLIHHEEPIPAGWEVVVVTSWFDFNPGGAGLAPGAEINTFSFARTDGPVKTVRGREGVRFWSPVYAMGELPGAYARDWWVSIGIAGSESLPAGHYGGWFRSVVPRAVPSWIGEDEEGNLVPLPTPVPWGPLDLLVTDRVFDVVK
jgi:hypothetical protein